MPSIGLLILAAGASTRMGDTPKQLLPYKGRTLLRHAAETALASRCRPVLVVLGAYADRLQHEIADLPAQFTVCEPWQRGMGASIRTGVNSLMASSDLTGIIVTLADMPLLSAATYDRFSALAATDPDRIIAAEYDGIAGVPAYFPVASFPELLSLPEESGAKKLLQRPDTIRLSLPEAVTDIDTPTDYALLQQTD